MKIFIKIIALSLFTNVLSSQVNVDCYTVIAGKDASFDGSVLMGHNEDDSGEKMLVNWIKVPRKKYKKRDSLKLLNGHKIEQAGKTNSYIWLQVTKQKFADAYMNENSVVICSDACLSKEDTASGQIGYLLRQIMAERSTSAKHAVKIAGKLIEEFGYESSGRTYCIADKNEVWMLSIVKGKRWVAQRIPDDHIAIIPNYYTIQEVDLSDSLNFLYSPDIIEYAVKRGWYDIESEKVFNFREVYGDSATNTADYNIPRHLTGLNYFSEHTFSKESKLPVSIKPEKNVTLEDFKYILSNHFENSGFFDISEGNNNNPHKNNIRPICVHSTQFSFIAQLRNNMPNDIGSLLWISAYNGCINPYVPIYFGIKNIHESYRHSGLEDCKAIHFQNSENSLKNFPNHAYFLISKYVDYIDKDYGSEITNAEKFKTKIENELKSNRKKIENSVIKVYEAYPDDAKKIITQYCNDYLERVIKHAKNYK